VTACARCGFDPDAAIAARWQFFIERDPPSLNARLFNQGSRRWSYAKERDAWCWMIRAKRLEQSMRLARAKRRVTLTRFYNGRQQERDLDNLAGGMKIVVDALVSEGLLRDDSPKFAELHYAQLVCVNRRGLEIAIEELAT
jgi:Holliday junction resolvase RusA-like endonuclease